MKVSEYIQEQVRMIKNHLPAMLTQVRELTSAALESPLVEFSQMGNELAAKEAVFLAMGGFQAYFDMMELLIKTIKAAEDFEARKNGPAS